MRIEGTLAKWNDDRGFGFIAPTTGGPEVFVHASAFPKDGQRPRLGERLSFEIETGNDGKKQAKHLVCLDRSTVGRTPERPRALPHRETRQGPGWLGRLLPMLLVAGLGYYGYGAFMQRSQITESRSVPPVAVKTQSAPPVTQQATPEPAPENFRCDGRQHCSQMTSCAEATFFLRNCPNTKMDGDADGVPCEEQWCNSPFAR
ncbi:cold-shock protein [Azonexus hydrophilus]|uniref:Cold-shock protein n=1 Tax=Azonexus hydrophilus TaxID=418702 RepID=A0A1R1I1S7_9RHOO|nr:cold shock domain-containing protein [Azonexus hydrophilus]OMG52609.1 cold-shock protein [Azonexus hydrophilus]